MPWRKRFICRFVSIVTVVLFTISETLFLSPKGFAGEPSAISSQFPSALHHPEAQATYGIGIPSEFGRTDEVFAGRSDKKIVFIQDAHDSLEAQENTARIIGHLVGKQGVRTVFEEGYEGEVPTDRYFGWIKDAALKKQIAYFLLDQLRLSGSEYAHVLGDTPFKLVGIDNASLHRQNIRQYRASLLNRPRIEKDLNVLEEGLQTLASAHFSGKLKEWLDIKRRLDRGQLPLADYIRRAYSLLPEDVRSDLGGKLRVIPLLADPAGPSQDTTKGEDIANTNPQELFDEIDGLEDALGKVFLQSDLARKIYDFLRLIYLLKRLNGLEITLREYQSLRMLWGKSGTRAIGRLLVAQTGKPLALSKRWERNIRGAVSFYGLAHERDRGISKSLDTFLAERGASTAVLVFGGFHKESIRRILRAKNISYVIVTPKISELSPKHQQYYKQLMSVGRHSYETSWAVKTAVAPERVYSGVRAEDFWDYLANLPLTTAQRQLLATQLPSLMKREKGRSELRSDEKRPPFAFKTQGLTAHQKEVVYEAADWMVKAIRKEPSGEPLSDSEVRYLNGRLDEVKVVSFVSMMTLAWRQIALKGPVSSSGYSRRLLGVGGRRILPILLSPFYFILRTVTEYFSNRYLFFGSFEDFNKTIYLTPRLRAAADTLFKRVVRHELAHALGYDDNELSFLGYLEDAKVPFNETEIKANFPSPVMAEIFDRAKTMGFPALFGEDNLPEHYERTRGPGLTFPKDLVERDGEFRRAWKASFLPAGYFIGHQIGCFAFKCWYRFVLSPVSRHLRMLRVIRSGRLRELDFYLTRMARNGLTFEFSTWIYRRILRRAEQTLRHRFFLLKGIDPAFSESYSNQSARLGMVIAFISSRPGLTDAERYQYAKVMIARAKDSGLAAAAEDIDRMIAARSELRSQPANDDSMRLTAQDFPELSKLIGELKANIARAVSAKFLPQISKVYPSASDGRRRILYPGSGADASSFFLATNATEGFFVTLENAALPGLKESLREFSESKGVNYLFQKGPHLQHFSVSKTLVEYPNILPLAVFEILGLGAEEVALRDHGSGKIEIQFDWRHPGDPAPKRRSLILISSSDLGKYETYGDALPQGLDGVFTKAIGGGKYFSPDFEQKIAGKLSAEAVIVTDHPANWAISLGGEEEFFYPEEFSGGSPQGGALTDYPFGHAKVAFLKRNPAGSMTDSERLSLILDDLDDAKAPWLHPRFTGFFLGQFQKRLAAFEQLAERIERISGQIGAPGVLRWQNRELITRLRKYVNLLGLIGDRLDREKAGRVLGLLTSFSNLAAFDNEGSDLTIPLKLLSLVVRAKIMQEIFGDTESKDRLLAEAEGLASSDHGWNSDAMRDFVRDQAAFFDVARSEMRNEESKTDGGETIYRADDPALKDITDLIPSFREQVLTEDRMKYLLGIKRMVNPDNKLENGLYPASGVDQLFWLVTNARTGYFVDQNELVFHENDYDYDSDPLYDVPLETRSVGPRQALEQYIRRKALNPGSASTTKEISSTVMRGGGIPLFEKPFPILKGKLLAPLLLELFSLGAREVKIRDIPENGKKIWKVEFSWRHPSDSEAKPRTLFFVSDDFRKAVPGLLKHPIQIFMEKAFDNAPSVSGNVQFIPHLLESDPSYRQQAERYRKGREEEIAAYRRFHGAVAELLPPEGIVVTNGKGSRAFSGPVHTFESSIADVLQGQFREISPDPAVVEMQQRGLLFGFGPVQVFEKRSAIKTAGEREGYPSETRQQGRAELRAPDSPPAAMPKDKFNYWIIRYNRELTDLSKKFKKNQLTGGEFLRFVKQRVRHANPSFQLSVPIDPQAKVTALQLAYFQEDLGKQVIAPNGHLMIKDRFGRGGYLMEIIPSRTEHLVTPGGLPVTVYAVEEPEECAFEALLNMRDEIVYSVTHERRLLEAGRSLQSSAARISGLDVEPTPLREVPQAFSARVLSALFEQYGLEEAVRVMRRSDLTEEMGHADALSYAGKLSRELNDDYMQDQYFRIAEALVRPDSYLRQLLTEAPGRQDARNALGMSVFEVEGKLNAIARGPAPAYAFMNIVEGLLAGEFRGKADHGEGGLHGMYSNAKEVILALLAPELLHKTENVTAGDWIDFLEENSLKDGKIDVSALEEKVLSAAERVYRKQFLTLTERQLEVLAADAASNLKQEQIPEIMAALEKGELKLKGEDLDVLKIVDGKEVVIGQIDRNIAHAYGLMHRVPTTFIVTPEGKFLFQRRAHNLAEPLRISLFGGHVKAGHGYLDTIRDEIVEELGLPKDWVVDENRLKIIRTEGAFGSPEGEAFARNRERRSHYVYFTTAEEIEIIRERGRELERKLAELGEVGFKAWLVREQEANNGLGEVWSVHEYDYDELAKHSAEEFSSDLLLPLLTHPANEDVRTFLKEAATPTRPDRSEMRNGTEKMTARDALYSLGNSGGLANVKSKARSFDAFEKLGLDYPAGVVIGAGAAAAIKDGRAEFLRELIGEIKKRFERGVKVAVRSSPLISMPGRMESVLNVDVADTQALEAAIVEVARSWDNPEAVDFRRASNLPDDQGTEIIIQEMVPQDNVRRWASGTFFTRDPEHGWTGPYGRYLLNSHGAALMTGGEKGETIHQLSEPLRERFQTISGQLEKHFGFPQEVEFLVSFKDAAGDAKPGELMPEKIWLLSSRDMVFSPQGEAKFLRQIKDPFQRVSWLEKMQQRRSSKGVRKQYKLRNGVSSRSLSNQWLSRGEAIGGAMEGFLVVRPESFPKYEAEHKPVILIMTPDTQDEMLAIALRYPGAGAITNYGNSASHEAVLFRLAGIPAVIRSDVVADNSGASFRQDFGNRQYVKEGDKILLLGDGLVSLPPEKAVIEEDPVVRDFVHGIDMAEYKQAMMEAFMTPEGKVKPEVTYQQLVEANADAWSSYIKMDSMGLGKEAFEANVRKHYLHEILSFKGAEEGRDKESIRKDIVEALLAKLSIPFADDPAAHGSPPKGEIPFAEITTNWMREGYEIVNRWVGYCPPQYEGNEGVKAFKQRYDQAVAYSQALAETVGGEVRTHKVTLIYHEKIHESNEDYLSYIAVVKKRERLLPSDSSDRLNGDPRLEMRAEENPSNKKYEGWAQKALRTIKTRLSRYSEFFPDFEEQLAKVPKYLQLGQGTDFTILMESPDGQDTMSLVCHRGDEGLTVSWKYRFDDGNSHPDQIESEEVFFLPAPEWETLNHSVIAVASQIISGMALDEELSKKHSEEINAAVLKALYGLVAHNESSFVIRFSSRYPGRWPEASGIRAIASVEKDGIKFSYSTLHGYYSNFGKPTGRLIEKETLPEDLRQAIFRRQSGEVAIFDALRAMVDKVYYGDEEIRKAAEKISEKKSGKITLESWDRQLADQGWDITWRIAPDGILYLETALWVQSGPHVELSVIRNHEALDLNQITVPLMGRVSGQAEKENNAADYGSYVVHSDETETQRADTVSKKGENLLIMKKLGLPVPEFVIVGTRLFREMLLNGKEVDYDALAEVIFKAFPALGKNFELVVRPAAVVTMPGILPTMKGIRTRTQLADALRKSYASWDEPTARAYAEKMGISRESGIAVVIQKEVHGDRGEHSASGVFSTRASETGENMLTGTYRLHAPGEATMTGTADADFRSISGDLAIDFPKAADDLKRIKNELEDHYQYPQLVEFVIDHGKLWLVQTDDMDIRPDVETRILADMFEEGILKSPKKLTLAFQSAAQIKVLKVREDISIRSSAQGIPLSGGAVQGALVFSAEEASAVRAQGQKAILVASEKTDAVLQAMINHEIDGLVTFYGNYDMHDARIARVASIPAIALVEHRYVQDDELIAGPLRSKTGEMIILDGNTGRLIQSGDQAPLEAAGTVKPARFDVDVSAVQRRIEGAYGAKSYSELLSVNVDALLRVWEVEKNLKLSGGIENIALKQQIITADLEKHFLHELLRVKWQEAGLQDRDLALRLREMVEVKQTSNKPIGLLPRNKVDLQGEGLVDVLYAWNMATWKPGFKEQYEKALSMARQVAETFPGARLKEWTWEMDHEPAHGSEFFREICVFKEIDSYETLFAWTGNIMAPGFEARKAQAVKEAMAIHIRSGNARIAQWNDSSANGPPYEYFEHWMVIQLPEELRNEKVSHNRESVRQIIEQRLAQTRVAVVEKLPRSYAEIKHLGQGGVKIPIPPDIIQKIHLPESHRFCLSVWAYQESMRFLRRGDHKVIVNDYLPDERDQDQFNKITRLEKILSAFLDKTDYEVLDKTWDDSHIGGSYTHEDWTDIYRIRAVTLSETGVAKIVDRLMEMSHSDEFQKLLGLTGNSDVKEFDLEKLLQRLSENSSGRPEMRLNQTIDQPDTDFAAIRTGFLADDVINPKGDVVFVMEQKTIDALPVELWRELIGLALIHKTRFHLVVPDAARAGYSARVEQLKGSARVHFDLPGITRNRKSRLVALSDTRKDIERFREALGEELSQKVYGYLGADRPGDFSVALLYAIGDISRQELSEKDGYLHDETGRFAAEALETLYAAYEVIVTAA